MARQARSAERFKYGICLNDECPKCKSKEVQQIPLRKDLVCPECGKPLRECPPPPTGPNKMLIGGIIAAIVIAGGATGGYFATRGGDKAVTDSLDVVDTTTVITEPVKVETEEETETQAEESKETEVKKPENTETTKPVEKPKPKPQPPTTSHLNLSYGSYDGDVSGGYPNGRGTLKYTTSRQISRYDSKARMAQPGDVVSGTFKNGFLVIGRHFDSSGNLIESLNLGSPVDGVYEDK